MLRTADLDYDLPQSSIATRPAEPRDSARLMVVRIGDASFVEHRVVRELPEILAEHRETTGPVRMVFNTTRVLPARFEGVRADSGGRVQGLYLGPGPEPDTWIAMIKARRFRPGARIDLDSTGFAGDGIWIELVERSSGDAAGAWVVRVHGGANADAAEILERTGRTPLPPYILAARKEQQLAIDDAEDRDRYQTVYASGDARSVAAPTAGLHFTPGLLDRLTSAGVARTDVTLHVGPGTFKPVESDTVEQHPMHSEWCSMGASAVDEVRSTAGAGGTVLAVGTTSARALESYGRIAPDRPEFLETDILITPGHRWAWTGAMLTNFHLPRSTLMAMIAARLGDDASAVDRLCSLYRTAVADGYRFYSYGDAMLILP